MVQYKPVLILHGNLYRSRKLLRLLRAKDINKTIVPVIIVPLDPRNYIEIGLQMAKPNYSFEKRQKEIAKKKKQEEKRQRKIAPQGEQPQNDQSQPPTDVVSGT
jgi:tmRNA-binding protein